MLLIKYIAVFIAVVLITTAPFILLKRRGFTLEKHYENMETFIKLEKKRKEFVDDKDFFDALESNNININD